MRSRDLVMTIDAQIHIYNTPNTTRYPWAWWRRKQGRAEAGGWIKKRWWTTFSILRWTFYACWTCWDWLTFLLLFAEEMDVWNSEPLYSHYQNQFIQNTWRTGRRDRLTPQRHEYDTNLFWLLLHLPTRSASNWLDISRMGGYNRLHSAFVCSTSTQHWWTLLTNAERMDTPRMESHALRTVLSN